MIIAYASMTGNVRRFVDELEFENKVKVNGETIIDSPFVLITYTTGFGVIPKEVESFFQWSTNRNNIIAVVGSGNRNWGNNFCGGAKQIAERYNIPLLHMFEISGLPSDLEIVTTRIKEIEEKIDIDKVDRVK